MLRKTDRIQRGLFPGALEMMILKIVRRQPAHGYALAQMIKQDSGDVLLVEDGSLYPALTRMLRAGWLTAEWGISSRDRKVRIYRITAAGRKQLEREVAGFQQMMDGIVRVMRTAER